MSSHILKCSANVSMEIVDDYAICRRGNALIKVSLKSPRIKELFIRLKNGDGIPILSEDMEISKLRKLGIVCYAADDAFLKMSHQMHYDTSFPINRGRNLNLSQLKDLQEKSHSVRFFSNVHKRDYRLRIPDAMRRMPSIDMSTRGEEFSNVSVDLLKDLLFYCHDPKNKLIPSAGGLYPIHICIEDICEHTPDEHNIYYCDLRTNSVSKKSVRNTAGPVCYDPMLTSCRTRIWFYADLRYITFKYGARGYRYALLESGHIAQVIINILNYNDILCRPFGGFDDINAHEYLSLADHEVVTYAIGLTNGKKSSQQPIIAQNITFAVINRQPFHVAVARGDCVDSSGARVYGFGADICPDMARLKSEAELQERSILFDCSNELVDSNGMAAHTDFQLACENGMLELYERHCFLRVWHSLLTSVTINLPNTSVANMSRALAKACKVQIALKDVSDPAYEVPCVIAVMYTNEHGGIAVTASASSSEEEAVEKALLEMTRFLFYQAAIKKIPVFCDHTDDELLEIKRRSKTVFHQAYYLRTTLPREDTEFLWRETASRDATAIERSIHKIIEVVSIRDLSSKVKNNKWKVIKAYSDKLINIEFGDPTEQYYKQMEDILGKESIRNRKIHPFG